MTREEHLEQNKKEWLEFENTFLYKETMKQLHFDVTKNIVRQCKHDYLYDIDKKDTVGNLLMHIRSLNTYMKMELEDGWISGMVWDYMITSLEDMDTKKIRRLHNDGFF